MREQEQWMRRVETVLALVALAVIVIAYFISRLFVP
jgi:hypothetical protein